MANTGSTLTQVAIDHIGQITFADPSDNTYMAKMKTCTSLDATARQFTPGEYLMFTARRTSGTDGVQYYINASFSFQEH